MPERSLQKPRLVCSAQTFGFGPISKLFSVARALKQDFSLCLFLDSDRNVFPLLNPEVFQEVYYTPSIQEMENMIEKLKPVAILSSYEPDSILAAKRKGVSSYFIDGLFWFWKLGKSLDELYQNSKKLVGVKNVNGRLKMLTPHERIFTSHFLANKSYVQYDATLSATKRLKAIKQYTNLDLVGAILNNVHDEHNISEDHILLTLGGEIFPTVSVAQSAMYAQLILEMAEEASAKFFKKMRWLMLVNPLIRKKLLVKNGRVEVRDSVGQEAMYALQRRAAVIFSPPGLTTTYECAALKKPVVFLPEQSIQYKNAYWLQSYGFPLYGGFFHDIDSREDSNEDGLRLLYKEKIPKFQANHSAIFQRVFSCCSKLEKAQSRRRIASSQRKAILGIVRNFNGAKGVANDLKAKILGSRDENTN